MTSESEKHDKNYVTTPIIAFYENRSLLITGSSGFLGKVIVEKLLRCVPKIKNLYLLIRPQNGVDPQTRLEKMLESKLFDQVKKENPEALHKCIALSGDLMQPDLGLSQPDMRRLCDEISVVLHCAATIKFDEALRASVEMNVVGTQRLVALCHRMPNLVAIVHASTAYANCDRTHIMEGVYPPPIQPQKLIEALEWMSEEMIEALTPHLVGRRPNTYTYTKALCEYVLSEDSGKLPLAIVRPSIIGAIWKEPLPGWTDNLNGPTGLFAAVGKGLLRSMHGDCKSTADVIPVDLVSNCIIVAAWDVAVNKPQHIPVINCCSGRLNRVTWGEIVHSLEVNYHKYPMDDLVRVPVPRFTTNRLWRDICIVFDHLLPAYVIDLTRRAFGRRPRMVRIYQKILKAVTTLEYFTTREWDFQVKHLTGLMERMSAEDEKIFSFDVRRMKWEHYLEMYCIGVKKYVLNEDMAKTQANRKNLKRLLLWSSIGQIVMWIIAMQILIKRSKSVRNLWFYIISMVNRIANYLPGYALMSHSGSIA